MRKTSLKPGFLLLIGAILLGLLGCKEPIPTDLNEYVGIWKLQDTFLADESKSGEEPTTAYYWVIKSDSTVEVWTNRGYGEEISIEPGTSGTTYWIHTRTPRNPSWDGEDLIVELSRSGDNLKPYLHPKDNSWSWKPVFDRVSALPGFSYSNDFESGNLDLIMVPHGSGSTQEWGIVADPSNASNNILKPIHADENSDLDIKIRPGENFTISYDLMREKQVDGTASCWTALDFNMYPESGVYNSFWLHGPAIDSVSFGDRKDDYTEISYPAAMTWDVWHNLKVTVRDGKTFTFYLDGTQFGTRTVEETLFTSFKIEGNPDTGIWYMDNLNITWNE